MYLFNNHLMIIINTNYGIIDVNYFLLDFTYLIQNNIGSINRNLKSSNADYHHIAITSVYILRIPFNHDDV